MPITLVIKIATFNVICDPVPIIMQTLVTGTSPLQKGSQVTSPSELYTTGATEIHIEEGWSVMYLKGFPNKEHQEDGEEVALW